MISLPVMLGWSRCPVHTLRYRQPKAGLHEDNPEGRGGIPEGRSGKA